MKRFITIMISALLLLSIAGSASASYFNLLPNEPDPYLVSPGDLFNIEIWLVGEAGDDVVNGSYRFDIGWDASELELESIEPLSAVEAFPPGFINIKELSYDPVNHRVEWFDGFGFGEVSLDNPILYGSIDFRVLTPVEDGLDDVWVDWWANGGITIDWVIEQPSSIGPEIAAVSIPGAVPITGILSLLLL